MVGDTHGALVRYGLVSLLLVHDSSRVAEAYPGQGSRLLLLLLDSLSMSLSVAHTAISEVTRDGLGDLLLLGFGNPKPNCPPVIQHLARWFSGPRTGRHDS